MRFVGRDKDMLKVAARTSTRSEVEGHLLRHPAVHQVAVVGYPDARLTEVAVAFVVPKDGAAITAEALIAACRGRIASFKVPRHVFLVEDLPTTSSGKIRKVDLREQALRLRGG